MKHKVSILYSWFIRTMTYFLPNLPIIMRFRGFLYSLMMKECGKNFQVSSSTTLLSLSGLSFGSHVYIGTNSVILSVNLKIEDEVLIGPNCIVVSGNHTKLNGSYRFGPPPLEKGEILIKRGSWIAANCTVLSGAILPESSILAAGAVLNRAFTESSGLYAGVPASLIKKI